MVCMSKTTICIKRYILCISNPLLSVTSTASSLSSCLLYKKKLLEILQDCRHMAIIIIMKQNIFNKRRVFQNEIRSQQIESILKNLRKQAFGNPNENNNQLSLD
jgi:hypothetical protein